MLSQVSKKEMQEYWKNYVKGGGYNSERIKSQILASWQRCRGNVNPYQHFCTNVLPHDEIVKKRQKKAELLEISLPIVKKIYDFVSGSGFVIALSNSEGFIIEMIGDRDAIDLVSRANFVIGSCWSEEIMGTNAIGTSIISDEPIQICSYEHWCICVHAGTCSGAPIHDPDTGRIIGAIDMTASSEKVHSHTLGMIVAAVESIEGQIALSRNIRRIALSDKYKDSIMESMSEGLLAIDNLGTITHINNYARHFLNMDEISIGDNIFILITKNDKEENCRGFIDFLKSENELSDVFLNIKTSRGYSRCTASIRNIMDDKNQIGKIIVLNDIARTQKLVTKFISGKAEHTFSDLIGNNRKFVECIEVASRIANSSSNVLLLGESGTGKELFAQAIHNASARYKKPFIAVNCAAATRDLLRSELFGYVEGAFTGAKRGGAPGKFELANGGTIFLDEIGDMPFEMQSLLLRFLEDKKLVRVGSGLSIPVDVRIIAATNKNLSQEVDMCNFRSDLFYRLNVINIMLPPLRERKDDIILLIQHLIRKYIPVLGEEIDDVNIEPEFLNICQSYDWPGNIRELRNVIERAINMSPRGFLSVKGLPSTLLEKVHKNNDFKNISHMGRDNLRSKRYDAEKKTIVACLEQNNYNKSAVAKKLGIARSTLYRKLENFELSSES